MSDTITDFAQLGYDSDEAIELLRTLGIIEEDAVISDTEKSELESLALVANLVLLDAISDKSFTIEEQLQDYEIAVSKLSAMQEYLTLMYEKIDLSSATAEDLFEFVETEKIVIEEVDTTMMNVDYTFELDNIYFGQNQVFVTASATYDSIADYITALETNVQVTDDYTILELGYVQAFSDAYAAGFKENDGTNADFDDFIAGDAYLRVIADNSNSDFTMSMTRDDFVDYLIAVALQETGYIGEDVFLTPAVFASNTADFVGEFAKFYTYFTKEFWGNVTIDSDPDTQTLSVAYNGTAMLMEMGLTLAEYSQKESVSGAISRDSNDPYTGDTTDNSWFWYLSLFRSEYKTKVEYYDNDDVLFDTTGADTWWEWFNEDITSNPNSSNYDAFENSNIDLLMEAAGTAIESQSTTTEVGLMKVNSSITEWGELNDVWDLIHEYIHDALKRASDNSL